MSTQTTTHNEAAFSLWARTIIQQHNNNTSRGTISATGTAGAGTSSCPRCSYPGPHQPGSGTGPHFGRLSCGQCGRWLRWLPKPRPVESEGRHG